MSEIKFDIQIFGGGASGGGANWSSGITKSSIEAAYASFSAKVDAVEDSIRNYAAVDAALQAGWSGTDCNTFLEKFHTHAESVCTQIDEYREAVKSSVDSIINQWESFQNSLIS